MKKLTIIIPIFLLIFLICGKSMMAQTVSGAIDEKTVKRGKLASGKIILTIPNDLHVNSNKPSDEFLIPTNVTFTSPNIKISKVIYPKAKFKKFSFSEKPLSIYEGQAVINFTFLIPANFKNSEVMLDAEIQFQACNHEVCFPPKKQKITLSAKIK